MSAAESGLWASESRDHDFRFHRHRGLQRIRDVATLLGHLYEPLDFGALDISCDGDPRLDDDAGDNRTAALNSFERAGGGRRIGTDRDLRIRGDGGESEDDA